MFLVICFFFPSLPFKKKYRFLDFTTAVRYEGVDMDSCFLSEKSKPAIQPVDFEIRSETQMLPSSLKSFSPTKEVCYDGYICAYDHN